MRILGQLSARLCLLLLTGSPAFANYVYNRGLSPLGEKEAFMANTGVALTGSTGAVYYNPAALNSLSQGRLSLSGNSYVNFKTEYAPLDYLDGTNVPFTSSGTQAVPSTFVSTRKFESWVGAFSVLVPEQTKIQDIAQTSTTNYILDLNQLVQEQLVLVGISGATKISDHGLGASCFWAIYESVASAAITLTPRVGTGTGIINSYESMKVQGLMCHLGYMNQISPEFRVGASLKTPLLKINSNGNSYTFTQTTAGVITANRNMGASTEYKIPMEIATGIAYDFTPKWSFYLDLSYQLGTSYRRFSTDASETSAKSALRPNLGVSYEWSEKLKIYAGAAYNPSAAEMNRSGDVKEDFRVFSLGSEWTEGVASLGAGVYFANSDGSVRMSNGRDGSVKTTATAFVLTSGFNF